MPTSDTRTYASITIPLSSTRSRTSIRLVPPGALSTAIASFLRIEGKEHRPSGRHRAGPRESALRGPGHRGRALAGLGARREPVQPLLELLNPIPQLLILRRQPRGLPRARQRAVELPPVQPDLLRLVDGAHQQPDLDGEQLDVREVHLDIAGDDEPLVQ